MAAPNFETRLASHPRLALDSRVFIYHVEARAPYVSLTDRLFRRIESGKHEAATSALSLTEVLTLPFEKGETELALLYRGLLTEFPHLLVAPLDASTAELAASIRAHYALATPDAIQIATALRHEATVFISNDSKLAKVRELKVLLLDDFL